MKAWVSAAGKLARYEHIGWNGVAPQPLLVLPFGCDREDRQGGRDVEIERELGGWRSRFDRHRGLMLLAPDGPRSISERIRAADRPERRSQC